MRHWFNERLAFIWIPILVIIFAAIGWMVFGPCTTQRCIDAQNFLNTLIEENK